MCTWTKNCKQPMCQIVKMTVQSTDKVNVDRNEQNDMPAVQPVVRATANIMGTNKSMNLKNTCFVR